MCLAMSFLGHIARCNNADLGQFEPWYVRLRRAPASCIATSRPSSRRPDLFGAATAPGTLDAVARHADKRTAACAPSCSSCASAACSAGVARGGLSPVTWRSPIRR
jgi:hypothetical protein